MELVVVVVGPFFFGLINQMGTSASQPRSGQQTTCECLNTGFEFKTKTQIENAKIQNKNPDLTSNQSSQKTKKNEQRT